MNKTGIIRMLLPTAMMLMSALPVRADVPGLPVVDFTSPDAVRQWVAANHVASLKHTPEGIEVTISGGDPYIIGPPLDLPETQTLWLDLKLRSEEGGSGQVFYFQTHPTEEQSVRFSAPPGEWIEARLPLPALGAGYRFRIDPPGGSGKAVIARMSFRPRILLKAPQWPKPEPCRGTGDVLVHSGPINVREGTRGCLALEVAGYRFGMFHTGGMLGYLIGNELRWLDFSNAPRASATTGHAYVDTVTATDQDGATWTIRRSLTPGKSSEDRGSLDLTVTISVNRDRKVAYLPVTLLFAGSGSFGERKGQALFAGLEYLEDEPSSSEADIIGPASRRQVPDTLKITFPLMVLQVDGVYGGLIWEPQLDVSALFDSPDRIFSSGGHVMGLLFPGSDGQNRVEGDLLPYEGVTLAAGTPLQVKATIIGGKGDTVIPAVQQYVELRGLPPLPDTGRNLQSYASLAARGWLDSDIRDGKLFRHAVWPGFGAVPAADAPAFMLWLAGIVQDEGIRQRLEQTAGEALSVVDPSHYDFAAVSHIPYFRPSLLFGSVLESADKTAQEARGHLARFDARKLIRYTPQEGRPDYGRTHFADHASGLTGGVVWRLLQQATFAGDRDLVEAALKKLQALTQYDRGVPRGAQTWEVPLHTPDILASAHMVNAFVTGYQITGDQSLLERARYWAWTGVPFVYLVNPTGKPVGPYSTIAVYGATDWRAPVWFGLPVQWCGLVYADALYRLARHDADGPWKKLADGITAAGIQHSWKEDDAHRVGLLPDFYHLREQRSDGPAINPGTVQANAIRFFGQPCAYDFQVARKSRLFVHAPGEIGGLEEDGTHVSFSVRGWRSAPYRVLVSGLEKQPSVRINGANVRLESPHAYADGRLVLQVEGNPQIEITLAEGVAGR